MDFADLLKTARNTAGMKQRQLADAIGVSQQLISDWETGEVLPLAKYVRPLSAALGIDAADIALRISDEALAIIEIKNKEHSRMERALERLIAQIEGQGKLLAELVDGQRSLREDFIRLEERAGSARKPPGVRPAPGS